MSIKIREITTPTILRFIIVATLMLVGGFGVAQQVQAAQTPKDYCQQYPADTADSYMRSACYDGVKIGDGKSEGAKCIDYIKLADQATVDICTKATNDRVATVTANADIVSGIEAEEQEEETPSPSPSPDQGGNKGGASLQDILDETKSLTDYIDVLHGAGKDADVKTEEVADNEYGKYINGAGQKQRITPDLSGKDNSPAIIIMNGGGWHANDQNDDFIRENKPDSVHNRTQTGPTAKERGYTVFELTYRLGSSGVYYMFEDVMRGIEHVRKNAEMYNIDPNKIAIWGDSAGGSLAVRAGASGKSGAKVAVGWSAPTNAYTALFKSYKNLLIGMDHSTCIPTDLAGLTNITDIMNGGSGDVAEYGKGIASNDFSIIGINGGDTESDPMSTLFQVLTAGQYALKTGQNVEAISQQLEAAANGGDPTIGSVMGSGLATGLFSLSSKKLVECMDNFKALSPAMYASPESTPMFLAGFDNDDMVAPQQAYDMHDKLQTLGIKSQVEILPGENLGQTAFGPNRGAHLDYDARFVCPTLNFIDSIIQPDNGSTNCETGQSENLGSAGGAGGGACTSRVDTRIRIKSVQEAELSAVVVPDPRVSDGGIGSRVGNGGLGKDARAGQNKNVDGTTKNKPKIGITAKSKDPSVGGNETEEAKKIQQNSNAGSGASGGGGSPSGGSGGGGSACNSGGGSSPATPDNTTTPTNSESANSDQEQQNPLGQLANLGGILSNLAGLGGGFGNGSSKDDSSSGGSTESASSTDFTSKRGSTVAYTESKRSGKCTVDYSRANALRSAGNTIVDVCNKELSNIIKLTGPLYYQAPIQIIFIPNSYPSDGLASGKTCQPREQGGRGAVAFALADQARLYVCSEVWNPSDTGVIVHEVAHLTQRYKDAPGWVTEGVADYVRRVTGYNNPNEKYSTGNTYGCNSDRTYMDGYKCTDAFFIHVMNKYNKPKMVLTIHEQAKKGNYTDSLITSGTNKTMSQLYNDCLQAECRGGKSL